MICDGHADLDSIQEQDQELPEETSKTTDEENSPQKSNDILASYSTTAAEVDDALPQQLNRLSINNTPLNTFPYIPYRTKIDFAYDFLSGVWAPFAQSGFMLNLFIHDFPYFFDTPVSKFQSERDVRRVSQRFSISF
jgi:hypothetical protein